jgi:hypothetical protein
MLGGGAGGERLATNGIILVGVMGCLFSGVAS